MKSAWGFLVPLVALLMICGMAMYTTGEDSRCVAAGGRLEWSLQSRTGYECVRDGSVIVP